MKKIRIILLAAALLSGTASFAQQNWSAGAGYSMTSFNGVDCSTFLAKHPLRGFYVGASHEFYFSALAGLTFEPGLYFHYQSGRNDADAKPKYIKMHYRSIPMDLKYSFNFATGFMGSFFTGPAFNVGLIGNLYDKGAFSGQGEVFHVVARGFLHNGDHIVVVHVPGAGIAQALQGHVAGTQQFCGRAGRCQYHQSGK